MGAGTCSRKSAVDGGGTIRKYFPSGDRLHYPQEKPYHFGTQVDISTLDLQDAFDLAVQVEKEAEER